jgi:integrase
VEAAGAWLEPFEPGRFGLAAVVKPFHDVAEAAELAVAIEHKREESERQWRQGHGEHHGRRKRRGALAGGGVMPRPATGQVLERKTRSGPTSYSIRYRVPGHGRVCEVVGYSPQMTRRKAEEALADRLADVRAGRWRSREEVEAERRAAQVPTIHEAATTWFEAACREGGRSGRGLTQKGREDLEWRLSCWLLPYFVDKLGDPRVDAIGVEDVDRFRRWMVASGRLGPTSTNKVLAALSSILEQAVEYGHAPRNVAAGKRRRLPAAKPRRTRLDRADAIAALLDAAGELDAERRSEPYRRPLLAVLVFGGLRIGEALALRWGDVDLARGTLRIRRSKTEAGERTVTMLPALRDELAALRAQRDRDRNALVFATATGRQRLATNVRNRTLAPAVERASAALVKRGEEPLPALTPHSLRRTYCSLLYALGRTPPQVMAQMGHTTPNLALAIYAAEMDRSDGEPERLRALVEGRELPPVRAAFGQMEPDVEAAEHAL